MGTDRVARRLSGLIRRAVLRLGVLGGAMCLALSSVPAGAQTVTVGGSGGSGSANEIAFGSVTVGADKVMSIRLTAGAAPVVFADSAVSVLPPFYLESAGDTTTGTYNGCRAKSLAAGASCTVAVRFSPGAASDYASFIRIPITTPAGDPGVFINLSGKGVAAPVVGGEVGASLAATPSSLDFGTVAVGASATRTFELTAALANVTFTDVTAPSGYSVTHSCGSLIPNGGRCSVSVTFAPTAAIPYVGSVVVRTTAIGAPHFVSVSGTGALGGGTVTPTSPPILNLDTAILDFGNVGLGSGRTLALSVANRGGSTLTVAPALSGAGFSIAPGTCGSTSSFSLPPATSCALDVHFSPAQIQPVTGRIEFSGEGASGVYVTLKGNGVAGTGGSGGSGTTAGGLVANPASIAFGTLAVGSSRSLSVALTASGAGARVATVTAPEGFSVSHNCDYQLASGQQCTAIIGFSPVARNAYSGIVTLTLTDASAVLIPVSGTGGDATAGSSPASLSALVRGGVSALDLAGSFQFSASLAGTTGNLYVAALLGSDVYFLAGGRWTKFVAGQEPAPYRASVYQTTELAIFVGNDVSGLSGAVVFLGYGRNLAEMLANRQYVPVYSIP